MDNFKNLVLTAITQRLQQGGLTVAQKNLLVDAHTQLMLANVVAPNLPGPANPKNLTAVTFAHTDIDDDYKYLQTQTTIYNAVWGMTVDRLQIMLHEVGHMLNPKFRGEEDEGMEARTKEMWQITLAKTSISSLAKRPPERRRKRILFNCHHRACCFRQQDRHRTPSTLHRETSMTPPGTNPCARAAAPRDLGRREAGRRA